MAIYHFNVKIGSKGESHSAGSKCAYITRTEGYAKKSDECAYTASGNMPKWPKTNPRQDPAHYWKAADNYERNNGRLYREVEFALPRELKLDQQKALCHAFADRLSTLDKGEKLPFTFAIHTDKDNHNPHCHLMLSERINDGIPRNASTWFKRANPKDPKKGGAIKSQELRGKQWLEPTRALWAELANAALKEAIPDFNARTDSIDHRSNEARGLSTIPSEHLGVACAGMMRRNKPSRRGRVVSAMNKAVHVRNEFNRQYPLPRSRLGRMVIGGFRAASAKHFGGGRSDGLPKTMKDIMRDIERLIQYIMRSNREIAEMGQRIAQEQLARMEAETQAIRGATQAASVAGMDAFFKSYDTAQALRMPEAKTPVLPVQRIFQNRVDIRQAIQQTPFIHDAYHACERDDNAQVYDKVLFAIQQLPEVHPVRQHADATLRDYMKTQGHTQPQRFDDAAEVFEQWFNDAMEAHEEAEHQAVVQAIHAQHEANKQPSHRSPWKGRMPRYVPNFAKKE